MTTSPGTLTAQLDNPFWRFSIAVYQEGAVKKACISLQDEYKINVNLLLLCCWLAYEVEEIPPTDFLPAVHLVDHWHDNVTQMLRQTRRWLYSFENKELWVEEYAQQVLVQEIISETYQQHILFEYFQNKIKKQPSINEVLAIKYLHALFADSNSAVNKTLAKELRHFVHLVFSMVDPT